METPIMQCSNREEILVYVGTYTQPEAHVLGKGAGIYLYRMDLASGALAFDSVTTGPVNPSFLALDPRRRFLYAVSEVATMTGAPGGAVYAYAIDPKTGRLAYLNRQPRCGRAPCYLSVEPTGRCVFVANYACGTVAVFPIEEDGRLGPSSGVVQHEGSSVNVERQEAPHPHSIVADPTGRFVFVADLGLDKIMSYRLDAIRGTLTPNDPPWVAVQAGAGPRHLVFHPQGRHAYLMNELDATLTAFAYDAARGALTPVQTVETLPATYSGLRHGADVHVDAAGRFVYASNRGHDSLVVFAIDAASGRLAYVGRTSTHGKTPRNVALDPTGTFLLAANQDTDTIVTFRIDGPTGALSPTGHVTEVPTPVCIQMMRLDPGS